MDEAEPFPEVFKRAAAWLRERELGTTYKYAMLTDGYVMIHPVFEADVRDDVVGLLTSSVLCCCWTPGPGI